MRRADQHDHAFPARPDCLRRPGSAPPSAPIAGRSGCRRRTARRAASSGCRRADRLLSSATWNGHAPLAASWPPNTRSPAPSSLFCPCAHRERGASARLRACPLRPGHARAGHRKGRRERQQRRRDDRFEPAYDCQIEPPETEIFRIGEPTPALPVHCHLALSPPWRKRFVIANVGLIWAICRCDRQTCDPPLPAAVRRGARACALFSAEHDLDKIFGLCTAPCRLLLGESLYEKTCNFDHPARHAFHGIVGRTVPSPPTSPAATRATANPRAAASPTATIVSATPSRSRRSWKPAKKAAPRRSPTRRPSSIR